MAECISYGKKHLNGICYEERCPLNSNDHDNDGICHCSNHYYYDSQNKLYDCFIEDETCESKGYNYNEKDGKECFSSLEDSITKDKKIFNKEIYDECPIDTEDRNGNGYCECMYSYYHDLLSDKYICLGSDKTCKSEGYDFISEDGKECYKTFAECISNGKKILNNICNTGCPLNSNDDDNDGKCFCSNYYYHDSQNELLNCFNEDDTCESRGYNHKEKDGKECFDSLEDSITKGKKIFNKEIYDECPTDTEDNNENGYCECKYSYYYDI